MSCKNANCYCSGACRTTRTFPSSSYGNTPITWTDGLGGTGKCGGASSANYVWVQPTDNSGTWPNATPGIAPYPNTLPHVPYTPSAPFQWPPYESGTTVTWTTPPTDSKTVYIVLANLSITSDIIDVLVNCRTIAGENGQVIVGIPMITTDQFVECEKLFEQLKTVNEVTLHNEHTLASEAPDVFVITRYGDYSVRLTAPEDDYIKQNGVVVLQFVELPVDRVVPMETTTISNGSSVSTSDFGMLLG